MQFSLAIQATVEELCFKVLKRGQNVYGDVESFHTTMQLCVTEFLKTCTIYTQETHKTIIQLE